MNTLKKIAVIVLTISLGLGLGLTPIANAQGVRGSNLSKDAGRFVARNFAGWSDRVTGPVPAGTAATIPLTTATISLQDGQTFVPFFVGEVVTIGTGSSQENVTVSAVTGCVANAAPGACTISATTSNAHGQGDNVSSSTVGLQEAIYRAFSTGGGLVTVDQSWSGIGGTTAMLAAGPVYASVAIEDDRTYAPLYWNPQGGPSTLAAPTTLTAVTAAPSATPVGAFGTGTYVLCIAYVDALGQEGPCSATFSEAGLTTGSFVFTAPAASTGAVGYTIYISLTGGTYSLSYKVPITSSICTMTRLETVTAACAVANAAYGQSGATATVTAITLNTSPIAPQSTVISTTLVYIPNAGGRTTATYAPASHLGTPGTITSALPFTIAAAAATVVPAVVGTINLAPGLMNVVGRQIEICGYATGTASAATIENIQLQWDAVGQNTAGKGVLIANLTTTTTFATTGHLGFCADLTTTVAGASATAGSILSTGGYLVATGVDLINTVAGGGNTLAATTGSLNLAGEARINVIYLHTTATDGAGFILQSLTVK